jgi:hypothetical protein
MIIDKHKFEALLRICISLILGFGLSVAYLPNVIPPGSAYMVGVTTSSLAITVPNILCSVLMILPTVFGLVVYSMMFGTMLLCAATVSDGLLVAIFSIFTLLMTTLYFGKSYAKTLGLASVLIVLPAMMALSLRTFADSFGMEGVKMLWTSQGLDNPLAVNRNLFIAVSWAVLCIMVGSVLPPFRTARRLITRSVLLVVFLKVADYHNDGCVFDSQDELVHFSITLEGKAGMTLFEPRLWRAEDLVTPLQHLLDETKNLITDVLLKKVDAFPGGEGHPDSTEILKLCAKALESNLPDDRKTLEGYQEIEGDALENL